MTGSLLPLARPENGFGIYSIRDARREDLDCLWVWRNDPVTRQMARFHDIVDRAHYEYQFASIDDDPARLMLVAGLDEALVAYATFAPFEPGRSAVISLTVGPAHRNQGHGRKLLPYFTSIAGRRLELEEIVAHIRAENAPSIRIFEQAGFRLTETENLIHRYRLTL